MNPQINHIKTGAQPTQIVRSRPIKKLPAKVLEQLSVAGQLNAMTAKIKPKGIDGWASSLEKAHAVTRSNSQRESVARAKLLRPLKKFTVYTAMPILCLTKSATARSIQNMVDMGIVVCISEGKAKSPAIYEIVEG